MGSDLSYRTENFIVMGRSQEEAKSIAILATGYFAQTYRKYFQKEKVMLSVPWNIYVTGDKRNMSHCNFRNKTMVLVDTGNPSGVDSITVDILPHEIAHIVVYNECGLDVPLWVQEGVATQEESDASKDYKQRRASSMIAPRLIKDKFLAKRDSINMMRHDEAFTYYALSYEKVKGLIEKHGSVDFAHNIKKSSATKDWSWAIKKDEYGIPAYK